MKRITIIGGGASGTLLAANLLRQKPDREGGPRNDDVVINLVEKKERVAKGVAYSTYVDCHLLNVPASRMGAFPDAVGDFHSWLGANGFDYDPNAFVPRALFGKYLGDTLNDAIESRPAATEINFIHAEATAIDIGGNSATV